MMFVSGYFPLLFSFSGNGGGLFLFLHHKGGLGSPLRKFKTCFSFFHYQAIPSRIVRE